MRGVGLGKENKEKEKVKWWEVMSAKKPEAIHLPNDLWSQFIMDSNAPQHHT